MKSTRLYDPVPPAGGGTALVPAPGSSAAIPPASATATPAEKHWTSTFEGLPDALRSSPALQPFKNPADAIKGYVDLQPLIGRDKVVLPKDWNDAIQVKEFNTRMGVPEKPEGYGLGKVLTAKLPKDTVLDEKRVVGFEAMAHEAGLTPRQAQIISEKYLTTQLEEQRTALQTKQVEAANTLNKFKNERGSAYDTDVAFAHKALVNFGDKETLDYLNETGLGDDPRMIKLLAKVGATLKEDTAHPDGLPPGSLQTNSADSARVRINELKADKNFMEALEKANHPNHKNAVEEWSKLQGMLPARTK